MFDFLKIGFQELQWVVLTALGIYGWVIKSSSASAKELENIRIRVTSLEKDIKEMPSKVELARVEEQLKAIEKQGEFTNKLIDKLDRSFSRIDEYLLKEKKDK